MTVVIDPTTTKLCQAQDAIGWDQIMKGRFAKQWNTQSTLPAQQHRHKNWTVEIIDYIFDQWWILWDLRNQDRHGHNNLTQVQASKAQAHRELHLLYTRFRDTAQQTLQWIFDTDVATRQQWTTNKLWQWINTWQPVLEAKTHPHWAPSNPENYPYLTELETG